MDELDRFARGVGRWALIICASGAGLLWLLPGTSAAHLSGFVFASLLGWALFKMKTRRAKKLLKRAPGDAGRRVGLSAMGRFAVMAAFLLLVLRNPRMDLVSACAGLLTTNVAVIGAAIFGALARPTAGG